MVFGILQSKSWGWILPKDIPMIGGQEIAPLGVSMTAYLILAGALILWLFFRRQRDLEARNADPLLKVSMLKIPVLRSGLSVLLAQFFIIAAIFFVVPVYLQVMLGYDAIHTGLKLLPLSIGLVLFSALGSRLTARYPSRVIVRAGQLAMAAGCLLLLGSVEPELRGTLFGVGMFTVGAGFGFLASQLGNVNMSAVDNADTAEVGGLQGTYQNLGTSLGTALVGSIFMLSLASGFSSAVQSSTSVPAELKTQISAQAAKGVEIVSASQGEQYLISKGLSAETTAEVGTLYEESQIKAIKQALFFVVAAAILSLVLSSNMPGRRTKA
jgi:predicted MFS family arabinose efflux permease